MRTMFEIILGAITANTPPHNPVDLRVLANNVPEFREKIREQMQAMQNARSWLQTARTEVLDLQGMLRILASDPVDHVDLIKQTHEDIQIEEERAVVAQTSHDEAEAEVARLQSLLDAASRLNPLICSISKPHKCHTDRPVSDGERGKVKHLFWMVMYPTKKSPRRVGPLGYRLESHRVIAFHDIKERTNSTLGNGRSRLRIVTDVDGNATTHGCEAPDYSSNDKSDVLPVRWKTAAKDSQTLVRLRFEERKKHYTRFYIWRLQLGSVHKQLLVSSRLLTPPESTAPREIDERAMKVQYIVAERFLQRDSSGRLA